MCGRAAARRCSRHGDEDHQFYFVCGVYNRASLKIPTYGSTPVHGCEGLLVLGVVTFGTDTSEPQEKVWGRWTLEQRRLGAGLDSSARDPARGGQREAEASYPYD